MGKIYDKEIIKEESKLTKIFLELRNDYEMEYDEKKQEELRQKMRNIFHKLCPLRKKLDIYSNAIKEDEVINEIISMIDDVRKKRPIEETFPIED